MQKEVPDANCVKQSELLYIFKLLYDQGKIDEIEYNRAVMLAKNFK